MPHKNYNVAMIFHHLFFKHAFALVVSLNQGHQIKQCNKKVQAEFGLKIGQKIRTIHEAPLQKTTDII